MSSRLLAIPVSRVFCHISVLDVEVNPEVPRMKSKAVHGRYSPVPHDENEYSSLTREEIFRIAAEELDKSFDRWTSHFDRERPEVKEKNTNQRQVGLRHEAQQPRLTTEADVNTDKKTRKRTNGGTADDEKKARGYFFCPGRGRPNLLDQLRKNVRTSSSPNM